MSAALPAKKPEPFSVEEAIDQGVRWCLESGHPASEIVTPEVVDMLSGDAFREFARRGFVHSIADAMCKDRLPVADPPQGDRPKSYAVNGRNPRARADALGISMMGADGSIKRLLKFDIEDAEYLRIESLGKETGWKRRRIWAARAKKALTANPKAQRIEQLPKNAIAGLRELADKAWS